MTARMTQDGPQLGPAQAGRRTMFLSYSRHDEPLAASIADDVTDMGVEVWRDERLSGGQAWWDTILDSVRSADAVIFVLSANSLDSVPCARELAYAQALGKPVLPVRVDSTSPNLAPPFLASLEWVDYSVEARTAVIRLIRAVNSLPAAPALPDPLPPAPDVPLSYTTNLAALVHQSEDLTPTEQHSLLFELREGLEDPAHREECVQLLRQLRGRRELLASVSRQVDEALSRHRATQGQGSWAPPVGPPPGHGAAPPRTGPPPRPPVPAGPPPTSGKRKGRARWVIAAFVAGLLVVPGLFIMAVLMSLSSSPPADDGSTVAPTTAPPSPGPDPTTPEPDPTTPEPDPPEPTTPESDPSPPSASGDDPDLDLLWNECGAGDFVSCDLLYVLGGAGTDYEYVGDSCGERGVNMQGTCASLPFPYTYGDDAALDVLQDDCLVGDFVACDTLYGESEAGSAYETVGSFCGWYATEPTVGYCSGG